MPPLVIPKGASHFVRLHSLLQRLGLAQPSSNAHARKAFILRVLLFGVIALIFVGLLLHIAVVANDVRDPQTFASNSLPAITLVVLLLFFVGLYVLSLRGHSIAVSAVFIGILMLFASYMGVRWGVDVNAAILLNILSIFLATILIGSRTSIVLLGITGLYMTVVTRLQVNGVLVADHYWRQQTWTGTDTIMTIMIIGIITVVGALSTWQAEHALSRAIASEEALMEERDKLEVTVERRTRQLRTMEMERIMNVYRFAEFGKLSSGLFHNLANHLTALTLSMDRLQKSQVWEVAAAKEYLERAMSANTKMREFIEAVRRQMAGQRKHVQFSPAAEIPGIVEVLSYRAAVGGVTLHTSLQDDGAVLYGEPVVFNQIVTNLLTNAIDAYGDVKQKEDKTVNLSLRRDGTTCVLRIEDEGCGIPANVREKIFEPFFTTKDSSHGLGIGLALVKRMVEVDFQGTLQLETEEGKYTRFIIALPLRDRNTMS